jgi:hypothetical protein
LRSWLGDNAGRDQYLTFRDADVNILWNGRNGNAEPVKADGKPVKNSVGVPTTELTTEMGRTLSPVVAARYLPRFAPSPRCGPLVWT